MTAEEQNRYINYLVERLEQADLGLRARDAVLQDFLDEKKILVERLSKLDAVLSDVEDLKKNLASEVNKRKAAERKANELKAKLKLANKNRLVIYIQSAAENHETNRIAYAKVFDK